MAGSPIVRRATAHQKRTHHQFVPGLGYVAHEAPPDLPAVAKGDKNCEPPASVRDGSVHIMKPPGGHPPMAMTWIAGERAWASRPPNRGNRLAWTPAHLSSAGWEYVGPEVAPPKGRGRRG